MRHPFIALAALAVFALAACSGPAPRSATDEPGYEIVRREEIYEFDEQLADVRIVNRFGDLRVRMAQENSLGVSAVIQRIGERPKDPQFRVERGSGRIEFVVELPGAPATGAPDLREGRVDLVVFVPQEAVLDVATEAGRLEVRHAYGPVRARTGSGELAVSSRERLDLASRSGLIQAGQLQARFAGVSEIASDSGDVQLAAPDREPWRLEADAAGGYTIGPGWHEGAIAPPPAAGSRWTVAHDSGGPTLRVRTGGTLLLRPVVQLPPD